MKHCGHGVYMGFVNCLECDAARDARATRLGEVVIESAITVEELEDLVEGPYVSDAAARAGDRLFGALLHEMREESDHAEG